MNNIKIVNIFSVILIIVSIIFSIIIQYYSFDKRAIGRDQTLHFYDMKKWYESGKLPTTSARFIGTAVVKEEFTTPRVPGGIYYIFYVLFYKLGNENLNSARFINLIFSLLIVSIFLIWLYKRFGLFIVSVMTPFILCNPYVIMAITDFWNPNVTLLFSFIFFIFLFEYIYSDNEIVKKISMSLIFPMLAIMAQAHFTVFFSMVPTLIVYLIIRFKNTKKYILYCGISIFISFLLYLPYLIFELKSNFNNLYLALGVRESLNKFPFPQVHSLLFFPTNEMSTFFGTRIHAIIHFWFSKPVYIYGLIFLFISVIFSIFAFIRAFIFLMKRNNINDNMCKTFKELSLILFLFIVVTIASFIIFRSKPGGFHYLYSAFSISFVPILLFFFQNEKKFKNNIKIFSVLFAVLILNVFAITGELKRYYRIFEEPRNYNNLEKLVKYIKNDAGDKKIKIYNNFGGNMEYQYEDIFLTYFPEYNINTSDNPEILYSIRDDISRLNWIKNRNDREMQYLIDNNAIELTNIAGYTIFKFPKVPD